MAGKYRSLDDGIGLHPKAVKFLSQVDDAVFGDGAAIPMLKTKDPVVRDIVFGLCLRLASEASDRKGDRLIENYKAVQRLSRGKAEQGQLYDHAKKAKAVKLFEKLIRQGKLVKSAEAQIHRELRVPPRTLRHWRKPR